MKPNEAAVLTRPGGSQRKPGLLQRTTRIALAVLLVVSHPLWAATIIVDETTCTLVDAITAANRDTAVGGCTAGSGPDTIVLTTDVSLIAADNYAYFDDNGLPVVESDIVLEGGGFTIERNADAPPFRLLAVAENCTLALHDVQLQNGLSMQSGGAVYNQGVTHLFNSSLSGNSAEDAGGAVRSHGVLTITETTLSGNAATGSLAPGGAIRCSGSATLTNSTISGNSATAQGGGIFAGGSLELAHTTVTGNTAAVHPPLYGGDGIYLHQLTEAHLTDSEVSGNSGLSAIVSRAASMYVTNVTVSGNTGVGIRLKGMGGTMVLTNSTVSGNGWGIDNYYAVITLTNTTVSDNLGWGIDDWAGVVTLTNTTISGNLGHGIRSRYATYFEMRNSTVTGNVGGVDGTGSATGAFPMWRSIVSNNGPWNCVNVTDRGGNFSDGGCGAGFGVITGLDPVLADNGGPTLTHALLPGSSAIDASVCSLDTDQRGRPRNDDLCDSGSYEFQCSIAVTKDEVDTLIWFTPDSSEFDIVAGYLSDLLADKDFSQATCLGTYLASPAVDTLPEPPVGNGRYYLARGLTSCVGAHYGDSSLTPDPRDALAVGPCP